MSTIIGCIGKFSYYKLKIQKIKPFKEQVVDIITDASDLGRHRTSLFVLSQSDSLFKDRPKLENFIQYKKEGVRSRDFERKLKHWHPNGAPRSGDRVDVFRVG